MAEIVAAGADEIVRMISNGKELPVRRIDALSLGAAFEIVCFAHATGRSRALDELALRHRVVTATQQALEGHVPTVEVFGAPNIEVRAAPLTGVEMEGVEWIEHRDRFGRALKTHAAFLGPAAVRVTASYCEMADNVISHAGDSAGSSVPAVVGFQVFGDGFEFAVADLGRGVLASLTSNPKWVHLMTHAEAVSAAVQKGASSRTEFRQGHGFKDLHVAISDLGAALRFRSGDASLMLDGANEPRAVSRGPVPPIPGFQLSVRVRR